MDSSVWFAAVNAADASNKRAKAVLSSGEALVTSEHILIETWSLLHKKLGRKPAERFWELLRRGIAVVEPVGSADFETAWRIGQAFPDQEFSIVDRTSFAVMQRLGIERAASFDADFATFRYGPGRRRAFTIVR